MADDPSMQLAERPISYSSSVAKIADLREGIGNVSVTGKIISVEARAITVKGEPRTVFSGIIADETGKVQFSAWNDFNLNNGDTVCVRSMTERPVVFCDVAVRVSDKFATRLHLDYDEANACGFQKGDLGMSVHE